MLFSPYFRLFNGVTSWIEGMWGLVTKRTKSNDCSESCLPEVRISLFLVSDLQMFYFIFPYLFPPLLPLSVSVVEND